MSESVMIIMPCFLLSLVLAWLGIATIVKRLHDLNKSGWFSIICFVPIINIAMLSLFFVKGVVGSNQYGDDPLANI